ncbi:hypothetical protein [Shewanella fidelis]|uniref:hypothetical protein n=1 Tax=Shewanella fidelis TaxID=173509 RepID=UPI0004BCA723
MKGILHAEMEVEIPFHDVDSMGDNCWHGNCLHSNWVCSTQVHHGFNRGIS